MRLRSFCSGMGRRVGRCARGWARCRRGRAFGGRGRRIALQSKHQPVTFRLSRHGVLLATVGVRPRPVAPTIFHLTELQLHRAGLFSHTKAAVPVLRRILWQKSAVRRGLGRQFGSVASRWNTFSWTPQPPNPLGSPLDLMYSST